MTAKNKKESSNDSQTSKVSTVSEENAARTFSDILLPKTKRHSASATYLIALLASVCAIAASLILSAETLYSARHPGVTLSCDVNAEVSCSTVAQSWQAEVIKLGNLSFPNAFFGISAESVFITIAVLGLAHAKFPRRFSICAWFGSLSALAYAYWLFTQSMYVINALCPWCLLLMFSTTIQFMAFSHATVTAQNIPEHNGKYAKLRNFLNTYYRLNCDLAVDTAWIGIVILLIFLKHGSAIIK